MTVTVTKPSFTSFYIQLGSIMSILDLIGITTAVCRIVKGFAFYSSKRPILRVIGGAEGVHNMRDL